ncbi:hypothetical protein M9H77_17897 [Catharanthus roseus]|uniref:Uncharacterized protein n=1 Tax=Catharanthus roseus TaxID=4058 RepID=A0ACC0B5X1_CATRO|nr:hypothetical protein M9H77_17897 [Catharanthus roseus]
MLMKLALPHDAAFTSLFDYSNLEECFAGALMQSWQVSSNSGTRFPIEGGSCKIKGRQRAPKTLKNQVTQTCEDQEDRVRHLESQLIKKEIEYQSRLTALEDHCLRLNLSWKRMCKS